MPLPALHLALLQHGKVYSDVKSLRYGHLMIMTDQVRFGMGGVGEAVEAALHSHPSQVQEHPAAAPPNCTCCCPAGTYAAHPTPSSSPCPRTTTARTSRAC